MKVTSKKQKGQRIFKVSTKGRPFWIEPVGENWWFSTETGEWYQGYPTLPEGARRTSYYAMAHDGFKDIYSLKTAKRTIHQWDVPKGTKFRVSLPWVGYEFIVTKP